MSAQPARRDDRRLGALAAIEARLGSRFSRAQALREQHAHGEGYDVPALPDAVAFPVDTEEVAFILRACAGGNLPVIPFGAGTSLEGQVQALQGGLSLDLSMMAKILEVGVEDLDCLVEAGVTREQLNQHLRDTGLLFPLDPGARATLGGMAATRASGTNAVRYGTMRDVVLGLTVVTPAGDIIQTGSRARKSAAGYDLTRLYVGSEGTLGVITELRLRLFGLPERIAAATCQFPSVARAATAVTQVLQLGVPLARIELLDALQMRASIRYSGLADFDEKPTLFVEFHGMSRAVDEQVELVRAVFEEAGGSAFRWAVDEEARRRLWKARHDAYHAGRALAPGKRSIATDACVPISQLAACIAETQEEAAASGLCCPISGHVGDGNFHLLLLFDPDDAADVASAEQLAASIARRAIAMGGTCSGEHGIGLHKLDAMRVEHGPALAVMHAIKQALDPGNIMNPGKLVPPLP